VPWSISDVNGHFEFGRLAFGKYWLVAGKPEAGYPDAAMNLDGEDQAPPVGISAAAPQALVDVRLGPKAGILEGTIEGANGVVPLRMTVEIRESAMPARWKWLAASASFRFLVPPDKLLDVTVSARGYAVWRAAIQLRPSQARVLSIHLVPAPGVDACTTANWLPKEAHFVKKPQGGIPVLRRGAFSGAQAVRGGRAALPREQNRREELRNSGRVNAPVALSRPREATQARLHKRDARRTGLAQSLPRPGSRAGARANFFWGG